MPESLELIALSHLNALVDGYDSAVGHLAVARRVIDSADANRR
jgi:hypothetical protein